MRLVHRAAVPTDAESKLVDAIRANGNATVSQVAVVNGQIVGHILFSPVEVEGARGLGLAPVAVLPEYQNQGVGGALIRVGIAACREIGARFIVVLGEPAYYRRFGFRPTHLGDRKSVV